MATLFTRGECELILANASDVDNAQLKLKDFRVEPALEAIGFLGDYNRLLLFAAVEQELKTSSVARQFKFFVKSLPSTNAETEKVAIFQKESNLYATIIKELQSFSSVTWCVKSYLTRDDLIVLQDLHELGYQPCKNMDGSLNDIEMTQILRGLAALHASSIVYEVRSGINIGTHYKHMLQEITVAQNVAWYTTGLEAVLAAVSQHPQYKSKEMQKLLTTKLRPQLDCVYQMMNPSTKYRNVFCHRDLWRGNIFFKEGASSALFVDFQTCRYCPASIDVIFAIFMNLDRQQRKLKEYHYLNWYYYNLCKDLKRCGIKPEDHMSQQDLFSSYHEYQLFGYIYKTIAATILEVPKHFVTNDYKHIERTKKVLEYMRENAKFRIYMEQCIEEIMELVQQSATDS